MAPLTYCSNIHPGESWADVMHNLESHALEVKARLGQTGATQVPFPLGLRISHQAAMDVDEAAITEFRNWCRQHDCYLLTINGFPYGAFHHQRVKELVYLPDWRNPSRVTYSQRLGDLAVALQPDAKQISISTVPIAFKDGFRESDWPQVEEHITQVLEHFAQLKERTGITLQLAIEPEPACVLETTSEAIEFFRRMRARLSARQDAHLGLCFDCCHQAVEFESAAECLDRLNAENIPIAKVQVSSALRAIGEGEIRRLLSFDEPVYLHQAVGRKKGEALQRFTDLPEFTQALDNGADFDECRVHFHVPIFLEHLGDCGTTQEFLKDFLPRLGAHIPLEVETYSFGVLPEHLRTDSVGQSIARELEWVTKVCRPQ